VKDITSAQNAERNRFPCGIFGQIAEKRIDALKRNPIDVQQNVTLAQSSRSCWRFCGYTKDQYARFLFQIMETP